MLTNTEKQRIQADLDGFVSAASDVSTIMNRRAEKVGMSAKSREDEICDPDVAEQELRRTADDLAQNFASAARRLVAESNVQLQKEFAVVGLECFAERETLSRLKELFPSRRKLDDIVSLLREATTRTLKRRVSERIVEAEEAVGNLSAGIVAEPLEKATRDFVNKILHYLAVTVGRRGDFLRKRFNLRLNSLVKAAHSGQLDSWTALSDGEEDEVTLYRRQASAPASNPSSPTTATDVARAGSSASLGNFPSSSTTTFGTAASAALAIGGGASAVAGTKSRLPASTASPRVTGLEASSTAVLDELNTLRERHDIMTQSRHEDVAQMRAQYAKEMEQLRQSASHREHALRTEAANMRVKAADQERVMKEVARLVRRLDLQSQRFKREISLLIELSRTESTKNVYALMARRLTQLEREDGTQRDADDELMNRLQGVDVGGDDAITLGAPCPSSAVLQKQHAVLDATSSALHTHQAAIAAHQEIDRLRKENSVLQAEGIHIRNQARHFETQVRKEASARELKLIDEIQRLKRLLSASAVKLNNANCHVIATTDELTADLVRKLDAAELRCKELEAELGIRSAMADVALREEDQADEQGQQQQQQRAGSASLRPQSRATSSSLSRPRGGDDNDDGDNEENDDAEEQRIERSSERRRHQHPPPRTVSPVVINPKHLEPDVRARIVARPPSSYTERAARPPLQNAVLAQVQHQEEQKACVPLEAPGKHARAAGLYWTGRTTLAAEQKAAQQQSTATAATRPQSALSCVSSSTGKQSSTSPDADAGGRVTPTLPVPPPPLAIEGGSKYKRSRQRQIRAAISAVERRIEQQQYNRPRSSSGSRNWNSSTG